MWVPPEVKDPILLHHPTRKSVGYFGAVRLRDGKFVFRREQGKFNAETFLDFLPSYSPDLNPIERVWKLTRRLCTHNRYFSTLDEVITAVESQFALWKIGNETLRRLCAIT